MWGVPEQQGFSCPQETVGKWEIQSNDTTMGQALTQTS